MKNLFASILAAVLLAFTPLANSGVMEDLLAIPAIQSLLGRAPELQAVLQRCADNRYRQRNANACLQAEQAARLAKVPPELRAVLAVPASSASLRDLCLSAQGTRLQETYLCAELGKADTSFKILMDQRRTQSAPTQGHQSQDIGK